MGYLYGCVKAEEKYRVKVFGCKERGRPRDGPLDHSTGKGWVKHVEGDYPDRHAKGSRLDIILLESYGGASPHTRAIVRRYARHASAKGVTDRTKYGATRASPKSFYNHHMQRLVKGCSRGGRQEHPHAGRMDAERRRTLPEREARLRAARLATEGAASSGRGATEGGERQRATEGARSARAVPDSPPPLEACIPCIHGEVYTV